jgi:hypothetical protein
MDCANPNSSTKAVAIEKASQTDKHQNPYLLTPTSGSYTLKLSTPLKVGQYLSVVQRDTVNDVPKGSVTSAAAIPIPLSKQCNANPLQEPYSDCDMSFSIIAGVEQSAQSSLPSTTSPFLRLFTRAGPSDKLQAWAYVRLLGTPQASSTGGVVSAVADPAGTITTQTLSGIGTSIDYMIGAEWIPKREKSKSYSYGLIAGYGGTTPLTANTLTQAFKSPAFGTVECQTLLGRFQTQFTADNIIAATSTNAPAPATGASAPCLVNSKSIVSTTGGVSTFTPVTTIGFSNQDRSSFLGKASIGVRTMDRFITGDNVACGDTDSSSQIGPCERGVVDFVVGQDASVTGGQMRNFVLKVDGVHPLPVKSVSFIYLFGAAIIRIHGNTNLTPLVLQAGDVAALTGNGANAVPNTGVVILPLTQPNRDFYRFGVGININSVFKKLFSAPAPVTP